MRLRDVCPLAASILFCAAPAASAAVPHTIAPGESLYSVAAADGLSVRRLAAANGLSADSPLRTGSTLLIPSESSSGYEVAPAHASGQTPRTASPTADADLDDATGYVVQPGDTLSGIAGHAGVSVAALAAANGLDPNGLLVAGTVLRVSGSGSGGSSFSPASLPVTASSQPVGAAAQGVASDPPYPTPERVSAAEVGQIAAANGVPPSLADAIGMQESGFNNDLVSSADARGVMQILPGTWDWINRTLTAGTPLAPASAAANVRGGVLLLRSLLAATGGNQALTAAGYYQGLPSVRQNGMYRDTQRYVNDVLARQQQFGGG